MQSKAWLGYYSYQSPHYVFKVRLFPHVLLPDYPNVELGALQAVPAVRPNIEDVLTWCPLVLAAGTVLPLADGSDTWVVPEKLKFDKATAPVIVSPSVYDASGSILWTSADFWESTVYYLPFDEDYTPVPESVPNKEHTEFPGGSGGHSGGAGASHVWMPVKSVFGDDKYRVATQQFSFDYTIAKFWASFAYEGLDLPAGHIWLDFNSVSPYVSDPYVQYSPGIKAIKPYNDSVGGYQLGEEGGIGIYYVFLWRKTIPGEPDGLEYYPPRVSGGGGVGGGGGIIPLIVAGALFALGGFGMTVIWPYQALVINGEEFEINGGVFEVK